MYRNSSKFNKRNAYVKEDSGCRKCRLLEQELDDLEEGRQFFKSASIGRRDTIAAAIEIMTGVSGGQSLDLIRLANSIRARYGELPAELLEEGGARSD